jgi:hypothetical protein
VNTVSKERIQKLFNIQPNHEQEVKDETPADTTQSKDESEHETLFAAESFKHLQATLPEGHMLKTMTPKEISERFNKAGEEFGKLYPHFEDFLSKKLGKLTDPYKELLQKTIETKLRAEKDSGNMKSHASEVAFGVASVMADLVREMMFTSIGPAAIMASIEAMDIHIKIDEMFDDEDDMTVMMGMISAIMQRMAHMIAHVQIEKMAGLHDGL